MRVKAITIAVFVAAAGGFAVGPALADLSNKDLEESVAAANAKLRLTDALVIAAREVGGGNPTEYEIDVEDGTVFYIIDIDTLRGSHTVQVDGDTGKAQLIED